MFWDSGGAPIFCCCAAAPLAQATETAARIASLTRPLMFFPPKLRTNLRWLLRHDIIAEPARFALRLRKNKFARSAFSRRRAMSTHHIHASRRRFLQFMAASPLFARSALAEGIIPG